MRIKESNLHLFPELGRVEHCGCGNTSDPQDANFIGHEWNRWFKVNGVKHCFHCVYEMALHFDDLGLI